MANIRAVEVSDGWIGNYASEINTPESTVRSKFPVVLYSTKKHYRTADAARAAVEKHVVKTLKKKYA